VKIELDNADLDAIADRVAERLRGEFTRCGEVSKQLWNEKETAGLVGVSSFFLKKARQEGRIKAHSTKRPILYDRDQIERIKKWLAERRD